MLVDEMHRDSNLDFQVAGKNIPIAISSLMNTRRKIL